MGRNRPRVFLDTNILVSAIFFSGNEEKLIELCECGGLKLVVSDHVLEEFAEVSERFGVPPSVSGDFLSGASPEIVARNGYIDRLDECLDLIRDPKDAPVLAAVLASAPDYFITGDRDFHTEEVKSRVRVMRTGELLGVIGSLQEDRD